MNEPKKPWWIGLAAFVIFLVGAMAILPWAILLFFKYIDWVKQFA